METLENHLQAQIIREYDRLGAGAGWRLLYSPTHVLRGADVALIAANPDGSFAPPDHGEFSMVSGSAYVNESWAGFPPGAAPLQRQVQHLFQELSVSPPDVLAGNLIPYRSPKWDELPDPDAAVTLGGSLWADMIAAARPKLIICLGDVTWRAITRVISAGPVTTAPVGWGVVRGRRAPFEGGRIIGLPHLSRYRVFGRQQSAAPLRALLAE